MPLRRLQPSFLVGTEAEWAAANPILLLGEQGFELDTATTKTGDGATAWLDLSEDAPAGAVVYDADDDLTLTPSSVVSGGLRTGATIRGAAGVEVTTNYTQTTSPAGDALVGSGFIATPTAILQDNSPSVGAVFQSGNFGPDGVFAIGSGYVQYQTNNTRLGLGPLGFTDVLRVGNVTNEARTITPAWGFMHARVWSADSAVVTANKTDIADGGAAFVDSQFYVTLDTGEWNGTTNDVDVVSLMSTPMMLGNVHFNRRIGVDIQDINGSPSSLYGEEDWQTIFNGGPLDLLDAGGGDVVENIGVLIRDLTHGTSLNLGVWSVPPIVVEGGVYGGTASGENLLLASTLHATHGHVTIRDYVTLLTEDKSNATTSPVILMDTPSTRTITLADTAGGFNTGNAVTAYRFGATVVYEEASNIISSGQLFQSQVTVKNANGEARSIAGFWTFAAQNAYIADGATMTLGGHRALVDIPALAISNAGVLNASEMTTVYSSGTAGTGCTVTTRRGVHIVDTTGTGTVTTGIGVDIEALSDATTSIGIRNASTEVCTPLANTNITATSATIRRDASTVTLTANASYTLASTPTIADGVNGQRLRIINVDTADTITLQDESGLAGSNLELSAATIALGPKDSIDLEFNSTIGAWLQVGQTNAA